MAKYLFSLISRNSVVFSGLLVFLFTSVYYGAEGRGVIAVGGAIISIIGILFSLNLGRVFIALVKKKSDLKLLLIKQFITFHLLLIFLAVISAFFYFYISNSFESSNNNTIYYFFLFGIPFYLWGVNSNDIYASLNLTHIQELIIIFIRSLLVAALVIIWYLKAYDLDTFLLVYYGLLSAGSIIEMTYIFRCGKKGWRFTSLGYVNELPKLIGAGHLDYLAFHLYPFSLTILASFFLSISDLGKLNFSLLLVNFIFLFSVVASIRIKAYVSDKGTASQSVNIKKLFIFTLIISITLFIFIEIILQQNFFNRHFTDFENSDLYMAIIFLAVPGHLLYQFNHPFILEKGNFNRSASLNITNFIFCLFMGCFLINSYNSIGFCISFVLFYLLELPIIFTSNDKIALKWFLFKSNNKSTIT